MKTVKILLREGIFDHEKNQKEQEHKVCVDCQPSWLGLCGTLLVGTTAAWFTDSVTSASNVIKSGNLDVKLEYKTGNSDRASGIYDIVVKGGKYYKFDPFNNNADGPGTNYVASGYKVVQDGNWYSVVPE